MRIATKEEFLTQTGTTVVEADPLSGIPEQTYLHYNFSDWKDARPFVQGYWAGVNEMKRNTEGTLQLNRMSKHAANCGVAEQSGNSQAPAEEEREMKRRKGMAIVSEEEYNIGKGTGNYVALAATPDTGQLPETTYVRMTTKGEFNLSDALQFAIDHWAEEGIKPEQIEKKDILEERQGTHGEFKDVASISQTLKVYFRAQSTWDALTFIQQETLDNIAQKIARIFAGNHNFADHWVDIQGYAKLAQQEIEKEWQ
jgi:hypothetical protein